MLIRGEGAGGVEGRLKFKALTLCTALNKVFEGFKVVVVAGATKREINGGPDNDEGDVAGAAGCPHVRWWKPHHVEVK